MKGTVVQSQDLQPGDVIVGLNNRVTSVEVTNDKRVVVTFDDSWPGGYKVDVPVRVERAS
jgi:hypothetical protein